MLPTTVRNPFFLIEGNGPRWHVGVPIDEAACIGCMECVIAFPDKAITVEGAAGA
jgi:NAD-dependent dihydropyrimidine dehydrogenase PreA subunit